MIKLKDILNEGTEDSIRDAYYNFGDGLEELNMLAIWSGIIFFFYRPLQ